MVGCRQPLLHRGLFHILQLLRVPPNSEEEHKGKRSSDSVSRGWIRVEDRLSQSGGSDDFCWEPLYLFIPTLQQLLCFVSLQHNTQHSSLNTPPEPGTYAVYHRTDNRMIRAKMGPTRTTISAPNV